MVSKCLPWLVAALALGACGDETTSGPAAGLAPSFHREGSRRDAPQFSDWPPPVNVGPMVNFEREDMNPDISRDGVSLYFTRHQGTPGAFVGDLWVSERTSVDAPWGPARDLGPLINTASGENAPALSLDGRRLFFNSNRPLGFGGQDLYVSRRRNRRDNSGWQSPENLGSAINTAANEVAAAFFDDDASGTTIMYFVSNRPGGMGGNDIYSTTLLRDGTFGPVVPVQELNSAFDDNAPFIRRDGLEVFLTSDRPGSLGSTGQVDLWVATRARTSAPWSMPVNLGPVVNTEHADGGPVLSVDGTALYFHSANRPGSVGTEGRFDLLVSTRIKLHRTVLVDPNGSREGTAKTIQAGIDMVAPGGRVRVAPGTYHEQVTVSKNDVVIVADDADDEPGGVVVDAHGHEFGFLVRNARGVTIEGFRVAHAHEADIALDGATFTTIRENLTTAAGHDGIQLIASNDNLIEDNVVVDNLASNACGINVAAGSKRNVVRDNRLVNNEWGIQIAGAVAPDNTLDNVISENTALRNRGNGIRNVGGASGTIIEDNSVVENGLAPNDMTTGTTAAGIRIGSGVGIVVRENRASGNLLVELLMGAGATATFEDNECGTSSPPGLCEPADDDDDDDDGDEGGP
jgi:hypothetical protein